MSSTDEIADLLGGLSLQTPVRRRLDTTSPPNSFLHSMNEKLSQRPPKPKRHQQHKHASWTGVNRTPVGPSVYYIVENQSHLLGVYSSPATATAAARLAGARNDFLSRWVDEGLREFGYRSRIIPYRLLGYEAQKTWAKDITGERSVSSASAKERAERRPSKTFDNTIHDLADDTHNRPDAPPVIADGEPTDPKLSKAPHPPSQEKCIQFVYVAMDCSLCLGLFTNRANAWEACMKHKVQVTYSVPLTNVKRWADGDDLPFLGGNISGGGYHCWNIQLRVVDEMLPPRKEARQLRKSVGMRH